MSGKHTNINLAVDGGINRVRLRGHLDVDWLDWPELINIDYLSGGDTVLVGPVLDQAALFGLLNRIRHLGVTLVSVVCLCGGMETFKDTQEEA